MGSGPGPPGRAGMTVFARRAQPGELQRLRTDGGVPLSAGAAAGGVGLGRRDLLAARDVGRGARPDKLRRRPLLRDDIGQGWPADFVDHGVAAGDRLARLLGVAVGSAISVVSPQGTATAFGTMPRIKTYHVAALFNVGMYEY